MFVLRAGCEIRPFSVSLPWKTEEIIFSSEPAPLRNVAGFIIFVAQCKSYHNLTRPRCEIWTGFLCPYRIWPFLGDLRAFRRPGGITYHPGRESVLNRKFAENNFFLPKM